MTRIWVLAAALGGLSACATIIESQKQEIELTTTSPVPASCELSNERGKWYAQTPATIEVKRSTSRLNVMCRNQFDVGQQEERATVNPWFFGNILIGGLIGVVTDAATGAMTKYEDTITVPMGNSPMPAAHAAPSQTMRSIKPVQPAHSTRTVQPVRPVIPAPASTAAPRSMPAYVPRYQQPQTASRTFYDPEALSKMSGPLLPTPPQ